MLALKSAKFLALCTVLVICHRTTTGQLVRVKLEKDAGPGIENCSQDTECVAGPEYCDIDSKSERLQNCGVVHELSTNFCCPADKVIRPNRIRRATVENDVSDLDNVLERSAPGSIKPFPDEPDCGKNTKSISNMTTIKNAQSNDWPWMVVLLETTNYDNFCGGVLLNRRFVLTAAHCFKKFKKEDFVVRVGEYDFGIPNDTQYIDHEVSVIRNHPDYDPATHVNDISILKLQNLATYSPYVRPICLPKTNMQVYTRTAVVSGWGLTSFGGERSAVLLEVAVPIWDHEKCVQAFSQPIFKTNICAAGYEGGKDSCLGDSGGPLMLQRQDGRWTNVGVVSWGITCAEPEHPGVYTKVTSYLKWISVNTQDYN